MTDKSIDRDPRLVIVSQEPFNAESPLELQGGVLTPAELFYVRNHFSVPAIDPAKWTVTVDGAVARPHVLSYEELCSLPARTLTATLECAGNGRASFDPPSEGEAWQFCAVSTAEWTGVSLSSVLDHAGVLADVTEIYANGADSGHVLAAGGTLSYERGLPLSKAVDPDTLLAYAMNGRPLLPDHGFPVRLLVPGWYGMASVKWITRLTARVEPFRGFYQTDRYVLPDDKGGFVPLGETRARSLITSLRNHDVLPIGRSVVSGFAWSGFAPVTGVEVRINGGAWVTAECATEAERYGWRRWEFEWIHEVRGTIVLESRVIDAGGNTQPDVADWNQLGYANNAVRKVHVTVA